MKVLMYTEWPYKFNIIKGGVESISINLINSLKSKNIELIIISGSKIIEAEEYKFISKNLRIIYYPQKKIIKKLDYLLFARKRISKLIGEFKPDIIHVQGTGPYLLSFWGRYKEKIIVTQHGILKEELKYQVTILNKSKFLLKYYIELFLLPYFRNLIFISNYNKKYFLNKYNTKNKINYKIIYNPVNINFFNVPIISKKSHNMIFIGALIKRKGLDKLLYTMHILRKQKIDYTLDIVGDFKDTIYKTKILSLVVEYGLENSIKFHGWLSQEELIKLITRANIFILPSNQETLPVSVAEALSAGRVVIASNVGGVSEMF